MTGLSNNNDGILVRDIVHFRDDLFFEGAVQLRWVKDNPERAERAATNFVFHGPRYHAVHSSSAADGYVLKDTATFVTNLVEEIAQGSEKQGNPFSLAIAGYGSGKSHLAVTLAELLSNPTAPNATAIRESVARADDEVGRKLSESLTQLDKPVLVVPLDGMANFNLGSEIARQIILQLRDAGCDLSVIEELSPRFKIAANFVLRNFSLRQSDFADALQGLDEATIIEQLNEHDEQTYTAVDGIYESANGAHIPVEGNESVQDLIAAVTTQFCHAEGPFSGLFILFDEFGRFLEYAAEHPHLAGDSALQQLFQGIQDASGRARFLGFIQYDLKAYVSRLDRRDLMHLQRYITRFEAAKKSYLSTNLETLFAHLIEKKQAGFVERDVLQLEHVEAEHGLLLQAVPEASRFPVWKEFDKFKQVIALGCWPLHPFAVWFLTRQQDVVQSRSALNIAKEAIERLGEQPITSANGVPTTISAADLLLNGMLPEFVAAEQARGGSVAETLQGILEERKALLSHPDRKVLAASAVGLKLGVRLPSRELYNYFLRLTAGVNETVLDETLANLTEDLGVLEWNPDFGQYELVQDAATRGQFMRLMRSRCSDPNIGDAGNLFVNFGRILCNLSYVDTSFANENLITTQDWKFDPLFASSKSVTETIANAFRDWSRAVDVNEAKGRIIYTFVSSDESLEELREAVAGIFSNELERKGVTQAPIWVVYLPDSKDRLAETLKRYWVLERGLSVEDRERYRRFVVAELSRAQSVAQEVTAASLSEGHRQVAGIGEGNARRLTKAGQEIFAACYPSVIPFPFDGFATASGAGSQAKKDVLELVRALVKGELNDEWIQSRPSRLRNRAAHVLANAWSILDQSGNVSSVPAHPKVKAVLEQMDAWHKDDPERSLEQTRQTLFSPPFGLNVASAGLLLGLFLGRRVPRWRISVAGQTYDVSSWLGHALKISDFDAKALAQSTVQAISEGALERWQSLIDRWQSVPRHRQRLEFYRQAKLMEKEDPVPDELLYKFEKLVDEARESQTQLSAFERRSEEIQRELERRLQKENSIGGLSVCDRVLGFHELVNNGEWEESHIEEVESLLQVVQQWVAQEGARWIERSVCRSPQQVADFRKQMEKAETTLKKLELPKLAAAVEQQKTHSIAHVEERFKYQSALTEAKQLVEVTSISSQSTILELENYRGKAKRFIDVLEEGSRILKDPELEDLTDRLKSLDAEASEMVSEHRRTLAQLYEAYIHSLDSAYQLRSQVQRLRDVFAEQRDYGDIEDARRQLDKVCADFEAWTEIPGGPEEIEATLARAITERCDELERWCEQEEVEPLWSFQEIYDSFACERVAAVRERAALWVRSSIPYEEDIRMLPMDEAQQKLRVLEKEPPSYLGQPELDAVNAARQSISNRIVKLQQIRAREEAEIWLKQFADLQREATQLPRSECEKQLRELRAAPEGLLPEEKETLGRLISLVEARLDELDLTDILARIKRMKPDVLRDLMRHVSEYLGR
ncbi:hypothetical protein [Marinobacter zhanjiangensis]|uniref:Uncharacterized protein n=1 Tax=Marinobacter zhanjiangensis TaxID=578215 RepID=A0ABQ3APK2_9GAMM|nr:hypothetical protein [Marinobacter zhanjiangensis]GGY63318.1 hypothetical protein GCM10007071_07380 [Marinobacter zhanjiangensis]